MTLKYKYIQYAEGRCSCTSTSICHKCSVCGPLCRYCVKYCPFPNEGHDLECFRPEDPCDWCSKTERMISRTPEGHVKTRTVHRQVPKGNVVRKGQPSAIRA